MMTEETALEYYKDVYKHEKICQMAIQYIFEIYEKKKPKYDSGLGDECLYASLKKWEVDPMDIKFESETPSELIIHQILFDLDNALKDSGYLYDEDYNSLSDTRSDVRDILSYFYLSDGKRMEELAYNDSKRLDIRTWREARAIAIGNGKYNEWFRPY